MTNYGVYPLYEGTFTVGIDKKFKVISRNESPGKGELKLSLNPFLIQFENRTILLDTGPGDFGAEPHFPKMQENLAALNMTEDDITDVVLSHLHTDHMGGLAYQQNGFWELSFPNAAVHVSGNEWKKLNEVSKADDTHSLLVSYLDTFANLNFLDDGDQPVPGISVEVIGGHTEFHLAIFAEVENERYVMAGDVLGTRGAVNRKYVAKYDFDGKRSMQMRDYLLEKAYKEQRIFLCYHETDHPMFRVTDFRENKGYTTEPVTVHESTS